MTQPLQSLALAVVTVDAQGRPVQVAVHDALTLEAALWTQQFVKELRFMPQMADTGEPEKAITLVLIRLLQYTADVPADLARDEPWVRAVLGRYGAMTTRLPVVNELRFTPARHAGPQRISGVLPDTLWTFESIGNDWCQQAFKWGSDKSGLIQRQWREIKDQPQLLPAP